jgi:anti-sigma B factor antagonist
MDRAVVVVSVGRHPVLWIDKAAVVSAPSEIDAANAGDLMACLSSVISEGATRLIVDLTSTRFCDSAAVDGLLEVFKQARASGVEMRLAVGGPTVRRVLSATGVDGLIATYPTVSASLMAAPAQPSSNAGG